MLGLTNLQVRKSAASTLAASLLFAVSCAHAVEPNERLADLALEARARAISSELRCLVCQNQSIDDSSAPLARDLRLLVRERLQAGSSDAEVMRYLVDRYGEFVLLKPRFNMQNALLWLSPFALLTAVALMLWSRSRRQMRARQAPPDQLTDDEKIRLERVLSDTGKG